MKTLVIIILAGVTVILFLDDAGIIHLMNQGGGGTQIASACNDTKRFKARSSGGGTEIIRQDASTYIQAFNRQNLLARNGWFISKKAIDTIFAINDTANGLVVRLGLMQDTQETNDTILIINPNRCDHAIITPINPTTNYFYTTTFCPTQCMEQSGQSDQ